MDLLSAGDRGDFRSAMLDVADTFFKTPITYKRWKGNRNRFKEDNSETSGYDTYTLMGLVEHGTLQQGTFIVSGVSEEAGKVEKTQIKITLNNDQLTDAHNLWDAVNNVALFNKGKDQLTVNGHAYDILEITYEGEFEAKNIHTVIYADPKDPNT